jgi:protein TonB
MVTGRTPSAATDRITDESLPGLEGISANLRAAITRGMASNPEARIRTVEEFQDVLAGVAVKSSPAPAARPAAASKESLSDQPGKPVALRRGWWWVAAAVVVSVVILRPFGSAGPKNTSVPVQTAAKPLTQARQIETTPPSQNLEQRAPTAAEQAAEEARRRTELEARLRAEVEAKVRAEADAKLKTEQRARLKAEADAKRKAEQEAKLKAAAEASQARDSDAPIESPKFLYNPAPAYPSDAQERGLQGTVVVGIRVMTDGSVGKVRVDSSSGYQILDQAALSTVSRWRFTPGKRGGRPVELWIKIPINFRR